MGKMGQQQATNILICAPTFNLGKIEMNWGKVFHCHHPQLVSGQKDVVLGKHPTQVNGAPKSGSTPYIKQ